MPERNALSNRVIGLAIEVHRAIGPGLLETVYQECMCMELEDAGIPLQSQAIVPVQYKGRSIPLGFRSTGFPLHWASAPLGFRSDIVVADAIILEIKAVAAIVPAHEARILTYLRMSGKHLGLLMNFQAPRLKDGLKRFIV